MVGALPSKGDQLAAKSGNGMVSISEQEEKRMSVKMKDTAVHLSQDRTAWHS